MDGYSQNGKHHFRKLDPQSHSSNTRRTTAMVSSSSDDSEEGNDYPIAPPPQMFLPSNVPTSTAQNKRKAYPISSDHSDEDSSSEDSAELKSGDIIDKYRHKYLDNNIENDVKATFQARVAQALGASPTTPDSDRGSASYNKYRRKLNDSGRFGGESKDWNSSARKKKLGAPPSLDYNSQESQSSTPSKDLPAKPPASDSLPVSVPQTKPKVEKVKLKSKKIDKDDLGILESMLVGGDSDGESSAKGSRGIFSDSSSEDDELNSVSGREVEPLNDVQSPTKNVSLLRDEAIMAAQNSDGPMGRTLEFSKLSQDSQDSHFDMSVLTSATTAYNSSTPAKTSAHEYSAHMESKSITEADEKSEASVDSQRVGSYKEGLQIVGKSISTTSGSMADKEDEDDDSLQEDASQEKQDELPSIRMAAFQRQRLESSSHSGSSAGSGRRSRSSNSSRHQMLREILETPVEAPSKPLDLVNASAGNISNLSGVSIDEQVMAPEVSHSSGIFRGPRHGDQVIPNDEDSHKHMFVDNTDDDTLSQEVPLKGDIQQPSTQVVSQTRQSLSAHTGSGSYEDIDSMHIASALSVDEDAPIYAIPSKQNHQMEVQAQPASQTGPLDPSESDEADDFSAIWSSEHKTTHTTMQVDPITPVPGNTQPADISPSESSDSNDSVDFDKLTGLEQFTMDDSNNESFDKPLHQADSTPHNEQVLITRKIEQVNPKPVVNSNTNLFKVKDSSDSQRNPFDPSADVQPTFRKSENWKPISSLKKSQTSDAGTQGGKVGISTSNYAALDIPSSDDESADDIAPTKTGAAVSLRKLSQPNSPKKQLQATGEGNKPSVATSARKPTKSQFETTSEAAVGAGVPALKDPPQNSQSAKKTGTPHKPLQQSSSGSMEWDNNNSIQDMIIKPSSTAVAARPGRKSPVLPSTRARNEDSSQSLSITQMAGSLKKNDVIEDSKPPAKKPVVSNKNSLAMLEAANSNSYQGVAEESLDDFSLPASKDLVDDASDSKYDKPEYNPTRKTNFDMSASLDLSQALPGLKSSPDVDVEAQTPDKAVPNNQMIEEPKPVPAKTQSSTPPVPPKRPSSVAPTKLNDPSAASAMLRHWGRALAGVALIAAFALPFYFVIVKERDNSSFVARDVGLFPTPPTEAPTESPPSLPPVPATPVPTRSPTSRPTPVVVTPAPTRSRIGLLRDFLILEYPSLEEKLIGFTTPQYFALHWLANNANFDEYEDEQILQRYALALLYYTTGGENWRRTDLWMSDESECDWYSSTSESAICDENGSLIILDLDLNNLSGTIPSELSLLTNLVTLDLSRASSSGSLSSTIPTELGVLQQLEYIALDGNTLSGNVPTEFGAMQSLSLLNLSSNALTGSVPSGIWTRDSLSSLSLQDNGFTGTLPTQVGLLERLTRLELANNEFVGSIPHQLGNCVFLDTLDLDGNQFTSIPTEIGLLVLLRHFSAASNNIGGAIPTHIGLMESLMQLVLSNNRLTGTIPTQFGNLGDLQNNLDLSNNLLAGSIPTQLGRLTSLQNLLLHENRLTGSIPDAFSSLTRLNVFRVESNNLSGSVSSAVCDVYSSYYPIFVSDCASPEIVCSCCLYCCVDGGNCSCQFAGTDLSFLCGDFDRND